MILKDSILYNEQRDGRRVQTILEVVDALYPTWLFVAFSAGVIGGVA